MDRAAFLLARKAILQRLVWKHGEPLGPELEEKVEGLAQAVAFALAHGETASMEEIDRMARAA